MEDKAGLEAYMLACPIKSLTGLECPGCGFQRGFAKLLQGDFVSTWHHYPPLFPFLLTMVLLLVALRTRHRWRLRILIGSFIFTLLSVGLNYAFKMLAGHP